MPRKPKTTTGEGAAASDAVAETATGSTAAAPVKAVDEPKPKAKAKTKADSQTQPVTEAAAKTKAKAKGEAKPAEVSAEPKSKAKAKAKSEAKAAEPPAVAEPKSKAKAKAKGKAESVPAPVSSPQAAPEAKSKAKKAKAKAEPAPPPPAPDPEEGMEVVKKKKSKKKKEEVPPEEPAEDLPYMGITEEEKRDKARAAAVVDAKNNPLAASIFASMKALPKITESSKEHEIIEQRKAIQGILSQIDEFLKAVKISRPRQMNPTKIMEQMRELRIAKDDGVFTIETRTAMIADMEDALMKALAWESFKKFQAAMIDLKADCENKLKVNEDAMKVVKAKGSHKRVQTRVAEAKGVKVEELGEVVSKTVELEASVNTLLPLFQRRYEKQFGLILDRPNAVPGRPLPKKEVTIRGEQADVDKCASLLKEHDFTTRLTVRATGKQASAIFSNGQANARKIEEEFPGVLIVSENQQVAIYGPSKDKGKLVAACQKRVEDVIEEEASKPPKPEGSKETKPRAERPVNPIMTMDQDRARALIGVNGTNVQKIEKETGVGIKVNFPKKDSEGILSETASVRLTGDKDKLEAARAVVKKFVDGLETFLCEAENETVVRLYDAVIVRKGKGKGKGKDKGNDDKGNKFTELRDTSGLTVVRKPNGVLLIGQKADVAKWKPILKDCISEASKIPESIKLEGDQSRIWIADRVKTLEESCGVTVHIRRARGEAFLEVQGPDDSKAKAKAHIEELTAKFSFCEVIEEVAGAALRALAAGGHEAAKKVEAEHGVIVAVLPRENSSIRILGTEKAVKAAKQAVQEAIAKAVGNTREIEIEWDEGRIVIGKSGNTVRYIRNTCGLQDLQVRDGEEKKTVELHGDEEAIEKAIKMIAEVIKDVKEGKTNKDDKESTKEIEIEWDEGRIVIGKSGNTVRHIRNTCGLQDVQVRDGKEKKTVELRGDSEAIEKGVKMIAELIKDVKEGRTNKEDSGESKGKGKGKKTQWKPKEPQESEAKKESTKENDSEEKKEKPDNKKVTSADKVSGKSKAPPADLGSKDLFPTLGGDGKAIGASSRAKGAWGNEDD